MLLLGALGEQPDAQPEREMAIPPFQRGTYTAQEVAPATMAVVEMAVVAEHERLAAPPAKSKRGRKAGSKVTCAPWLASEDEQLVEIVEAKRADGFVKLKDIWPEIATLLGTGRTVASVEQHWYYIHRVTKGGPSETQSGTKRKQRQQQQRRQLRFAGKGVPPPSSTSLGACALAHGRVSEVVRHSAVEVWSVQITCPTCQVTDWAKLPKNVECLPCHDTSQCPDGRGMSAVHCATCGLFLVPHRQSVGRDLSYVDEAGQSVLRACTCAGCVSADKIDKQYGGGASAEVAEQMRWVARCEAEGLCFSCGEEHHGQSLEHWIEDPRDANEQLQDVLFCLDCFEDVRNKNRSFR